MFVPNKRCRIQIASGASDAYGQPLPGKWVSEPCRVITLKLTSNKTSVRADSSASRGAARENQAAAEVMLGPKTAASIDDVLEIDGHKLRIVTIEPMYDATGALDHHEIGATIWGQP